MLSCLWETLCPSFFVTGILRFLFWDPGLSADAGSSLRERWTSCHCMWGFGWCLGALLVLRKVGNKKRSIWVRSSQWGPGCVTFYLSAHHANKRGFQVASKTTYFRIWRINQKEWKIRAKRSSETQVGHTFRQVNQKNITNYMSLSVHEIEFS